MKIVFSLTGVFCILIGTLASFLWNLPVVWTENMLDVLGNLSAMLFGVFGVWLGICYRPNFFEDLQGKKDKDLIRACDNIIYSAKLF